MTPYERYIFDGRCPYSNEFCYKECDCENCEVNTHEIEGAEELDMAEGSEREVWNGIHAQIIAPKGTFEKIWNEAQDDDFDV
jgi:hypothetical protein